jgi:hypothetical protein
MEPLKPARTSHGREFQSELPQDLRDLLERHVDKKRSNPTLPSPARDLPGEQARGPQPRVEAPPAMKRSKPARLLAFLLATLALAAFVMILELRMHHVRAASATAAPGSAPARIESDHGRPAPVQPGYHHRSKTDRNG